MAPNWPWWKAIPMLGYRLILPEDGNLNEKEWTGIGFVAVSAA